MWRLFFALVACSASMGCTIERLVVGVSPDGSSASADAGDDPLLTDTLTLERQWGVYTQTLGLTPCPSAPALVVDTLDDDLQGGPTLATRAAAGATLSLREALFLALNTAGPHTIAFDERLFAPNSGATIRVVEAQLENFPTRPLENTCLDARGRSVIVEFELNVSPCPACGWYLGPGSQLTGLVLKGNMGILRVRRALVAGTRFMIDAQAINALEGAVVGPMNVFGEGEVAIRVDEYPFGATKTAEVGGNAFGLEPTTLAPLRLSQALNLFALVNVHDNLSNAPVFLFNEGGAFTSNRMLGAAAVVGLNGTRWQVLDNVLEGSVVMPNGRNPLFRNTVSGAIVNPTGALAPLSDAGAGSSTGVCPTRGSIELYARDGGTWSPLNAFVPPCQAAGDVWSISSPLLVEGLTVSTLFTDQDNAEGLQNTGPFSAPLAIRAGQ